MARQAKSRLGQGYMDFSSATEQAQVIDPLTTKPSCVDTKIFELSQCSPTHETAAKRVADRRILIEKDGAHPIPCQCNCRRAPGGTGAKDQRI